MKRRGLLVVLGWVFAQASLVHADERGWSYLMNKLVADGVQPRQVERVFHDYRIPAFSGLEFLPAAPREPHTRYRRFLRPATVALARHCRVRYADAFEAAERTHGVSANVLAAILFVETGCGRNTGSSLVVHRLARLAMANEPDNLQRNIERFADDSGRVDPETAAQVRARGRYLEDTFYPEVRALFEVADRMGVDPIEVRGSGSGAFGYPQFLPTSYLRYGTDGDGDGVISLYDTDDAIASCARYFVGHGWRRGLSARERRAAVWQYNHSDAYVDTVLALAARVAPGARSATQVVSAKRAPRNPKASQLTRRNAKRRG